MSETLLETLDGARYVRWDKDQDLLWIWYGGRFCDCYDTHGVVVVDTIGFDNAAPPPSVEHVAQAIADRVHIAQAIADRINE